jgi:hypothetical protein
MFTTLAFGLCAFIVEAADQINFPEVPSYPAVAIGIINRDRCRISLVLPEGQSTPLLAINGLLHSFRVERISQTSAVLWIDNNRSFKLDRINAF